jgi:hypothetical protein
MHVHEVWHGHLVCRWLHAQWKHQIVLSNFTQSLADSLEKSEFSDEGSMDRCLGIHIQKMGGNLCTTSTLSINPTETNPRLVLLVRPLFSRDQDGPPRKFAWQNWFISRIPGYRQNSTRPHTSLLLGSTSMHQLQCMPYVMSQESNWRNCLVSSWNHGQRGKLSPWLFMWTWMLCLCWLSWWLDFGRS